MAGPVRIQLSRRKGWRMPENTVKVDRTTKWGNPFDFRKSEHCWTALAFDCRGDPAGRREASVKAFREWIEPEPGKRTKEQEMQVGLKGKDGKFHGIAPRVTAGLSPGIDEIQAALRGKSLGCWCNFDGPCHADVLLEISNRPICEQVDAK